MYMKKVLQTGEAISEYFNWNQACEEIFFKDEERFSSFYNSRFLIQSTTLAILKHREMGFSEQFHIEFWGLMQAIVIQQDSIRELYFAIMQENLDTKKLSAWNEIRQLRNMCAGHPSKKEIPKSKPITKVLYNTRISYKYFSFEQWTKDGVTHPTINIGEIIDAYSVEANKILSEIFIQLQVIYPKI